MDHPKKPTLGYACICATLRDRRPTVYTSRTCILKTFEQKGMAYIGDLALKNCIDLLQVLQWNERHGIRFFRISSGIFPRIGEYDIADVPQYPSIAAALLKCGEFARSKGMRLTFHPSHFVKLAAFKESLVNQSLRELEAHSEVFDMMGYEVASVYNKINIHIGGRYSSEGSKSFVLKRWASNFARLSDRCRARITVENDDRGVEFSVADLMELHELCGVPIVFDFHHHTFNTGGLTVVEALDKAISTWPPGIRPVVHWSESSGPHRRPTAHSDYVRGPIDVHGRDVDVMIEAKAKERALLAYLEGRVPEDEWVALRERNCDEEERPLKISRES